MLQIVNLSPDEVSHLLTSPKTVLIDVRETNEFASERIEGARNFPLSQFDAAGLPEGDLVLYCAGGARSVRAAEACDAAGVAVVGHLAGGIRAWMAAGLTVER